MAVPLLDASSPQFADLIGACPIVPGATVSRALINLLEGRVVLFAMDAEQEMEPLHNAPARRERDVSCSIGQARRPPHWIGQRFQMSEHRAPFKATVQVLDGRLRMTVGTKEREMTARDWLVMPADAPHSLFALVPTRFMLTPFKRHSA